jgi:threonine/homoserine/homoserine lactone efflux protein
MAYFEHLWLYFILLVGIVIVPGMDMMFVLANALVGGRRSGLAATAGIMAGGATHTVIGLTAVAILSKTDACGFQHDAHRRFALHAVDRLAAFTERDRG